MFPLLLSQFETGGRRFLGSFEAPLLCAASPSQPFALPSHLIALQLSVCVLLLRREWAATRRWSGVGRGNRGGERSDRLTRRCLLVSTRSRPSPLLHLSSTHRSLCSTHTHSSLPPHVVGVWERRRRRLVCCVCCFSVSGRRRRCGRARVHPLPIRKVRRLHPRGQGRRRRGCIVAD